MTGRAPRIAFAAYRGSMVSGGLGVYLHALTRALVDRGFEVDVYVGPPYPDPMPWARTIRVRNGRYWESQWLPGSRAPIDPSQPLRILQPLDLFELGVSRIGFFPETFSFSLRAAHCIRRALLRGVRYDMVHDVQTLGYGMLWLRALGLPVVATIHHPLSVDRRSGLARDRGFWEMKGTLTFHPVRSQARVARRIDSLITSSRASEHALQLDYGVRPHNLHNVGNGVALPSPGHPRNGPERPELLFLGRCEDPNKGFEFLLKALAQLPSDVRLSVFDAPPQTAALRELLRQPALLERVDFQGKRPRAELDQRLRSASALVMPSLFEGFGVPAVEALAVGTPTIATTAGGLGEVIERAGAGTTVRAGDVAALAAGIRHVLAHWKSEHETALASRARIEQAFSWHTVAERTVDVYRSVWRRRRAAQ